MRLQNDATVVCYCKSHAFVVLRKNKTMSESLNLIKFNYNSDSNSETELNEPQLISGRKPIRDNSANETDDDFNVETPQKRRSFTNKILISELIFQKNYFY